MDTHSMIFVTIDKLVSPSSSVDGDPLDDFPDHWQPHYFSAGASGPPPPNERSVRSRLRAKARPSSSRLTTISA
jgi:hypothetical protein